MAGKITTLNPSIFEFLIHDVFGAPGEFHHPGLGLGLGLRFRVMVRVRVSVRVRVMDRVRVGLGIGIGIGLGTGVVKFSGSACHPSLDLSLQTKLVSFTNPFLYGLSGSF